MNFKERIESEDSVVGLECEGGPMVWIEVWRGKWGGLKPGLTDI